LGVGAVDAGWVAATGTVGAALVGGADVVVAGAAVGWVAGFDGGVLPAPVLCLTAAAAVPPGVPL